MLHESLGSVVASLAASTLFGHERGAFTGATSQHRGVIERAHGSTLFLDELGKADLDVQRQLLRVLDDGCIQRLGSERTLQVDVRFIFASRESLEELERSRLFLSDLYWRIHGFSVTIPPLRERREDIPHLVRRFISELAAQRGYTGPEPAFTPELMQAFVTALWPGNVRQLREAVDRLMVDACGADTIGAHHLTFRVPGLDLTASPKRRGAISPADVAREVCLAGNNKSEAARRMRRSRKFVHRMLERHEAEIMKTLPGVSQECNAPRAVTPNV